MTRLFNSSIRKCTFLITVPVWTGTISGTLFIAFMMMCITFNGNAQNQRRELKKARKEMVRNNHLKATNHSLIALNTTKKAKEKLSNQAIEILRTEYPKFVEEAAKTIKDLGWQLMNETSPEEKIRMREKIVSMLRTEVHFIRRINRLPDKYQKPETMPEEEIQVLLDVHEDLLEEQELTTAKDFYQEAQSLLSKSSPAKAVARQSYHLLEKAERYANGKLSLPDLDSLKSYALERGTVFVAVSASMDKPGSKYNDLPSIALARLQTRFRAANSNPFLKVSFGKSSGADYTLRVKILDVVYDTDVRDPQKSEMEKTIEEEGKAARKVKGTITKFEKYALSTANLMFTIKDSMSGEMVESGGARGQDDWSNGWATLEGSPEVLDKNSKWHGWLKKSERTFPKAEILAIDAVNQGVDLLFVKVAAYLNGLFMDDTKASGHGK